MFVVIIFSKCRNEYGYILLLQELLQRKTIHIALISIIHHLAYHLKLQKENVQIILIVGAFIATVGNIVITAHVLEP